MNYPKSSIIFQWVNGAGPPPPFSQKIKDHLNKYACTI